MTFVIIGFAAVFVGLLLLWRFADRRARLLGVLAVLCGAGALYASRPSEERREQLETANIELCGSAAATLDAFRSIVATTGAVGADAERRREWSGMAEFLDLVVGHCVAKEARDTCYYRIALTGPGRPNFSANIDALIHGLETGLPCK